MCKINYRSQYSANWTKVENLTNCEFAVSNFEHAHSTYNIKLQSKREAAPDLEYFWSDPAEYTFTTNSVIPSKPPDTNVGAFFIDDNNNTFLYWTPVLDTEKNGANFSYVISNDKGNK